MGGYPPDREVGVVSAFSHADDGSPEFLHTLALSFANEDMNAHLISCAQFRDIGIYRSLDQAGWIAHIEPYYSCIAALGLWAARRRSIPQQGGLTGLLVTFLKRTQG
jgi:hypothetical protein